MMPKSTPPVSDMMKTSPRTPSSTDATAGTGTESISADLARGQPCHECHDLHYMTSSEDAHALEDPLAVLLSSDTDDDFCREQDAAKIGEALGPKRNDVSAEGLCSICCCLVSTSAFAGVVWWFVTDALHSKILYEKENPILNGGLIVLSIVVGFCCACNRESLCNCKNCGSASSFSSCCSFGQTSASSSCCNTPRFECCGGQARVPRFQGANPSPNKVHSMPWVVLLGMASALFILIGLVVALQAAADTKNNGGS